MTDEARQKELDLSGDQEATTNTTALQILGCREVASNDILSDLSAWQIAQGYEMQEAEFSALALRHLSEYFWRHLSGLSDRRFSERPRRRQDEMSFLMLLTDFERTQITRDLKASLGGRLRRDHDRRRNELLNSPEYKPRSLVPGIEKAVEENWCIQMGCTTCGSYRFRLLLLGEPDSIKVTRPKLQLTLDRAKAVVAELGEIEGEIARYREPIMVILYWIWTEFRDRAHSEIFPALAGTPAGNVLEDMKEDYDRQETRRAQHRIARRDAFH